MQKNVHLVFFFTINVKKGDKVKTKQTIGTVFTDPDNDNKTEMFFQVWKEKERQKYIKL